MPDDPTVFLDQPEVRLGPNLDTLETSAPLEALLPSARDLRTRKTTGELAPLVTTGEIVVEPLES